MNNVNVFYIFFIFGALSIGGIVGWFIAKLKFQSGKGIPLEEIEKKYISKEVYNKLEMSFDRIQGDIKKQSDEILKLNTELSAKKETISHLNERLAKDKTEIESLQSRLTSEFENIANRVLEARSKKFVETNKSEMSNILDPLKKEIGEFRKTVDDTYTDEIKEKTSLKEQLKQIISLNQQLSGDANKLANALKGDTKFQGNWGEAQLEKILERAGLIRNIHYRKQEVFLDDDGQKKQPDYIINLPDNKNLVIDSKVSLVAYERYFNSDSEDDRKKYLEEHLGSVFGHIKGLSKKNYQNLYQINPPDYVLMFIPIEPALGIAFEENPNIYDDAWDENIVLITGATLLATLRTVSYIWKQESQKKNVLEIARQAGSLYDKFVDFISDLKNIGDKLDQAKTSQEEAMKKLKTSKRKGDTLIGKVETIRTLGANSSKSLPQDMLDQVEAEQ